MIKFFKKKKTKLKFIKGFTMIETMISITVFLVVIMYGTTSLLNAYSINRKSQDLRSILDSLSFVMEDMSRNIRTGYDYQCLIKGNNLPTPAELGIPLSCEDGRGIAFESSDGDNLIPADQWVYYITGGKLYKSTSGLDSSVQMTTNEVSIDYNMSNFIVFGGESPPEDTQQPLAIIRLVGKITNNNVVTPFSLQTTVSQRINDI